MSKKILILSALNEPECDGKTLFAIASERHKSILDTAFEMIIKNESQVTIAPVVMSYKDVDKFLLDPRCMLGSDLLIIPGLKPHPRAYGALTRFLHRYVIEKHALSWEEAIYKMTGLPAQKFQLTDRGMLKQNMIADITIIDPKKVGDTATLINSSNLSTGIEYVFVNGQLAYEHSQLKSDNFGELILKSK
jgi:N-acyl-D-aspartate/D-glutamate deacylase